MLYEFDDTFGIRGLISDQTAYTLNARTAKYTKYTEQNRTAVFSGHMQMAYEELHMHKYIR